MHHWKRLSLATAMLGAAALVCADAAAGDTDERGRYEGMAASDNAVWVIDTHTGKVRKCTQEFADQTPTCSAYSE